MMNVLLLKPAETELVWIHVLLTIHVLEQLSAQLMDTELNVNAHLALQEILTANASQSLMGNVGLILIVQTTGPVYPTNV